LIALRHWMLACLRHRRLIAQQSTQTALISEVIAHRQRSAVSRRRDSPAWSSK